MFSLGQVVRRLFARKNDRIEQQPKRLAEIDVLDKGYVSLRDYMGGELAVVNAARASYARESKELNEKDIRLLRFLMKHAHLSPFRHALFTFEVKAPLLVARQWNKYVVGSDHTMDAWNETSRRYVTEPEVLEFYAPSEPRKQSKSSKQGSNEAFLYTEEEKKEILEVIEEVYAFSQKAYAKLIEQHNVAGEFARIVLPANAQYTNWRWTASMQSVLLFLTERLDDHAQWEIRQYAQAVYLLIEPIIPNILSLIHELNGSTFDKSSEEGKE